MNSVVRALSRQEGEELRIESIEVENFRSIRKLICRFDEITTLIGPNGAGKSTILRALDWFFNGEKGQLSDDDLHAGAKVARIRVAVRFCELTTKDRDVLGSKYAPEGAETFTVWRTWESGNEKITGRGRAYPEFEEVRSAGSASEKRSLYNKLRSEKSDLKLPSASSASAVDAAMDEWERCNPEALSDAEISDTHLFGFNARGKLSELFDFVFVSADLRASEEADDAKGSIFARILQRTLDRKALDESITGLVANFERDYEALNTKHLSSQLSLVSSELTSEVQLFTRGRSVALTAVPAPVRPQSPRIDVSISDASIATPVHHQGHGFQRTLLVAALTVLSRRLRSAGPDSQMFLAIEEPELFQHPTQAKAFASVLRSIAMDGLQHVQIAFATHSPYFVEPRYFDQVRRVTSVRSAGEACSRTRITTVTLEDVRRALDGYVDSSSLDRRWEQACLKYLPEALFAERVILVEGDEDAAVLEGLGCRVNELAVEGVCVASVSGKANMFIPFAVLRALDIQTSMVVDNDSGYATRMRAKGRAEEDIEVAGIKNVKDNRALCRFVNVSEEDFPVGGVCPELAFVPDTLESLLESDLPGWDLRRRQIINEGRGVDGKNAATYELAAKECEDTPGEHLASLLVMLRPTAA